MTKSIFLAVLFGALSANAATVPALNGRVYNLTSHDTSKIVAGSIGWTYHQTIGGGIRTCKEKTDRAPLTSDGKYKTKSLSLSSCGLWTTGYKKALLLWVPDINFGDTNYWATVYEYAELKKKFPSDLTLLFMPATTFVVKTTTSETPREWRDRHNIHGFDLIIRNKKTGEERDFWGPDDAKVFKSYYTLFGKPSEMDIEIVYSGWRYNTHSEHVSVWEMKFPTEIDKIAETLKNLVVVLPQNL